jgi:hypothetical protein
MWQGLQKWREVGFENQRKVSKSLFNSLSLDPPSILTEVVM